MYCAIVDDVAFIAGTFGKEHFRLAEMAVKTEFKHQGYGSFMIKLVKAACARRGKTRITLRTSKNETAFEFYQKIGGSVVGENGDDFEVVIPV